MPGKWSLNFLFVTEQGQMKVQAGLTPPARRSQPAGVRLRRARLPVFRRARERPAQFRYRPKVRLISAARRPARCSD